MLRALILTASILLFGVSIVRGEITELRDWVVAPAIPTNPCVCNGIGWLPKPTLPCYCYNGTYEYRSPNTLIGSFLSPTATKPPVIDYDPYFAENLANISSTPFWKVPWWFNTTVEVPLGTFSLLVFEGINYRADVWVGGVQVAASSEVVGTFRRFAFDISNHSTPNPLPLALRVIPPVDHSFSFSTDLAITFVDWNPEPPDRTMGLIDRVFLLSRDIPVDITGFSSHTAVGGETFDTSLSFVVSVYAPHDSFRTAKLRIRLSCLGMDLYADFPTNSSSPSQVFPYSTRVFLNSSAYHQLRRLSHRLLWNPWQMGSPVLHTVSIDLVDHRSGREWTLVSSLRTGFREVTAVLDHYGSLQFSVNKKKILIRGGGWSPDMFNRANDTLTRDQFRLVKDMHLNAIRLEGKFMWQGFFDLADEMGLMILPGWCCCDSWQHWFEWGPEQYLVSRESLRSQIRRTVHHPSVITFLYSSDQLPPVPVEENYLRVFAEEAWPNPTVSAASRRTSNITGPTGVKMTGPYAWVPPSYWLLDTNASFYSEIGGLGGAWGFLTEGGPGATPMTLSSWKRTVPSAMLWSSKGLMAEIFSFHCASERGVFGSFKFFAPALDARYGQPTNVEEALYKSQIQAYEGIKAMFEGYTKQRDAGATGIIQWMMNNAWPSHMWHLFDYFLGLGGAYYGAKKACQPLHIIFSYADRSITLSNSLYVSYPFSEAQPLNVSVLVCDLNGTVVWSKTAMVTEELLPNALHVLPSMSIPEVDLDVYFLRIQWNCRGLLDTTMYNDYWLGRQMDDINWPNSTWYITYVSRYANFTALQSMAQVNLKIDGMSFTADPRGGLNVSALLRNLASTPAFGVSVVTRYNGSDIDITPAMMSDSYFTLLPGESRLITGWLPRLSQADRSSIQLHIESYNNNLRVS